MATAEAKPPFDSEQGYMDVLGSFQTAVSRAVAADEFIECGDNRLFVGTMMATRALTDADGAATMYIYLRQVIGVDGTEPVAMYGYSMHARDEKNDPLPGSRSGVYGTNFGVEDCFDLTEREVERLCTILDGAQFSGLEAALQFTDAAQPNEVEWLKAIQQRTERMTRRNVRRHQFGKLLLYAAWDVGPLGYLRPPLTSLP